MDTEKHLQQYMKILIKEYEDTVLTDEIYETGPLTAEFIHNQYNVAVDKYLKGMTSFEAKHVSEEERRYYRGWISSHLTMMLNLAHYEQFEAEKARWQKTQAKLEKDLERLEEKHKRLAENFEFYKGSVKEKLAALKAKKKKKDA